MTMPPMDSNRGPRAVRSPKPPDREKVGIPTRVFLFTIDQIAVMLNVSAKHVANQYLYYEGRSVGPRKVDLMVTRNIAPRDEAPEWRVAEREFIRWMRTKGFRYYENGTFGS